MKRLIAFLLFCLFVSPVMAQDGDSMPAYLLVKAQDGWDPENPMVFNTGFPVSVSATNQYGGKQVLPKFVQFVVTDGTVDEIRTYCSEWKRFIDWEQAVPPNYVIDEHTLRVFVRRDLVSASGLNSITRDMVENYLNNWNATVQSFAPNEVTFKAGIFAAIESNGFWGRDVSYAAFTEESYNASIGLHEVEVNYSGLAGVTVEQVAGVIVSRGCTITKNIPNKITFTCGRETVFSVFKRDVADKINHLYAIRRWYITENAIDAAIAAGGSLDVTRQQAINYLHNRLSD